MFEEIKKRANFKINSINFVKRDGLKFLDIELPENDLKTIEEKSKIISQIIDELEINDDNFYLNVYSSGTEKEFDIKDINLFVGSYIYVKTHKSYLSKNEWEGYLLENNLIDIVLKINNKGRIQKLKIDKQQIAFLKTTAKLKK